MRRCTRFGILAAALGLAAGCATPAPAPGPTGQAARFPAVGAAVPPEKAPAFFPSRWTAPAPPAGGLAAPTGLPTAAAPTAPNAQAAPPSSVAPVRLPQVVVSREESVAPSGEGVTPASFGRPAGAAGAGVWQAVAPPAR